MRRFSERRATETSTNCEDTNDDFGICTFSKNHIAFKEKNNRIYRNIEVKFKKTIHERIKSLEFENQLLTEKIKSRELKIQKELNEESNKMTQIINKYKEDLNNYSEKLKNTQTTHELLLQKSQESGKLEQIHRENSKLMQDISRLKQLIQLKKSSAIPQSDSQTIANKLLLLENEQNQSLSVNLQLKKKLSEMKLSNYSKECSVMSDEDHNKLLNVYNEISNFHCFAKKLYNKDFVKFSEIFQVRYDAVGLTPSQVVNLIKKETEDTKNVLSDLYAEECGNLCQTY